MPSEALVRRGKARGATLGYSRPSPERPTGLEQSCLQCSTKWKACRWPASYNQRGRGHELLLCMQVTGEQSLGSLPHFNRALPHTSAHMLELAHLWPSPTHLGTRGRPPSPQQHSSTHASYTATSQRSFTFLPLQGAKNCHVWRMRAYYEQVGAAHGPEVDLAVLPARGQGASGLVQGEAVD